MKRKIKKFAEGDRVKEYNREDEGLFGAKIKYREDEDGRKYTAGKANPFDRNPQEQRYYSVDDVKNKLSGLFGGKKEDTSKYDDLKSVGEKKVGVSPQEEINRQIRGSKSEPKADAEKPIRKFSDYNQSGAQSTVDKKDAPYEVEKAEPKTGGGSGSSNRSSSSTKTSSSASKAAENKYKPNEERKSKPYPKDARPLKPVSKAEEDAEGERGKRMEEEAAAQMKKNKSVVLKQKDDDPTDKIIDKTVKDTSGAKTVYSDKPFSFTKNLQDKKDKEKKDKEKKDEDSKVSGPGGARMIEKNTRDFKGPFKDDETYKRMKEANKASLRSIETENQRTFKERAEAAKAEADKAEKKAEKKAAKEDKPAPRKESKSFAANKAKSGSTVKMGRSAGSKFEVGDPYSMMLGSEFNPAAIIKKDRESRLQHDLGHKKGGQIKKMAKGGSASSRADGIAARGKTRGRIY